MMLMTMLMLNDDGDDDDDDDLILLLFIFNVFVFEVDDSHIMVLRLNTQLYRPDQSRTCRFLPLGNIIMIITVTRARSSRCTYKNLSPTAKTLSPSPALNLVLLQQQRFFLVSLFFCSWLVA